MLVFVSCHFYVNGPQVQKVMAVGCDRCLSIILSMTKDGWRKISALQIILKVGITLFYSEFTGPPAAVVTPVAATPVVTTTGLPVQPAAVQQLQLQQQQLQQQQLQQQQLHVQQQQLQQQQLQQQQSVQVIAQQQAEVRAKIEEETQRKVAESSISHEENMSISGSNARYMVMQKLSRKSEVSTLSSSSYRAWKEALDLDL